MTEGKKIVLGLDPGFSSLGWSLISIENNIPSFIDGGVRIFTAVTNPKNGELLNVSRRQKRMERRQLKRYKMRRNKIERLFIEHGFIDKKIHDYIQYQDGKINAQAQDIFGNPYELRNLAVHGTVTKNQFAYLILHLAKKRGYMNAVIDDTVDEVKHISGSLNKLSSIKNDNDYTSLGEVLYHIYSSEPTNGIKEKVRGLSFLNKAVVEEFNLIISSQKENLQLTEDFIKELYHIIFYKAPLKVVQYKTDNCSYEKYRKLGYKTHPIFQEFKIWQVINNLTYSTLTNDKPTLLTQAQKQLLAQSLMENVKLDWKKIKDILKLDKNSIIFNYEPVTDSDNKRAFASGNDIIELFDKSSKIKYLAFTQEEKESFMEDIKTIDYKQYGLKVIDRFVNNWGFTEIEANGIYKKIKKLDMKHSSLSIKAMRKLLAPMKNGISYSTAVKEIYPQTFIKKDTKKLNHLPPFPNFRNPIVQKSLGQIRKIVNSLIEKYGYIDEIRLEMAREIKMGAKKLNEYNYEQKKLELINEQARADLEQLKTDFPSLQNSGITDELLRVKLFYELGGNYSNSIHLPYLDVEKNGILSPVKITLKDVLTRDIEIEHIIPQSISADDSFSNLTLCTSNINRLKNDKTIVDYYDSIGFKDEYLIYIKNTFKAIKTLNINKYEKFTTSAKKYEEKSKGFTNRHLNDTSFIAVKTKEHLEKLGCKVITSKGAITSELRNLWFNSLNRFNIFNEETTNRRKNRDDHRHHFIDAVITSLADERIVNLFYKMKKESSRYNSSKKIKTIKDQIIKKLSANFFNVVENHYKGLIISVEENLDPNGEFNKATAYGLRYIASENKKGSIEQKPILISSKGIDNLLTEAENTILSKTFKPYAKSKYPSGLILAPFNNVPKKYSKIYNYTDKLMIVKNCRDKDDELQFTYYKTSDNHHTEIWYNIENDKIEERVISLIEWHSYTKAKKKNGFKEKYINEMNKLVEDGYVKVLDLYKKSSYIINNEIYTLMYISGKDYSFKLNKDARSLIEINDCSRLRIQSLKEIIKVVPVKIDVLGKKQL